MKRLALVLLVSTSVILSVAVGSVVASSRRSPNANPGGPSERRELSGETDEAGVHGGFIERFHQAGGCTLTSAAALPDNWTHGDYVSAVAVTGDSTLVVEAAHSDCGKPMVSLGQGTDHALLKTEKHESRPPPGS